MGKVAAKVRMEGKAKKISPVLSILDASARLSALRQIRGMWKHRKPDPIAELAKIRREWDRELP